MNKNQAFYLLALVLGLMLSSCRSDDEPDPRAELSDITELVPFLEQYRQEPQVHQVDAQQQVTITGTFGTRITFPANAIRVQGGGPVSGTAELRMLELYDRGEMILWHQPTIANGRVLETGGLLKLRLTQGGTPLMVTSALLRVPHVDTLPSNDPMLLFHGGHVSGRGFVWTPPTGADTAAVTFIPPDTLASPVGHYRVPLNEDTLGWLNLAHFYNQTGPGRAINGTLGGLENYNGFITYCVYEDIRAVSSFSTHVDGRIYSTIAVPDNLPVKIITFGRQGGRYFYGSTNFRSGAGRETPHIDVEEIPEADLVSAIRAL